MNKVNTFIFVLVQKLVLLLFGTERIPQFKKPRSESTIWVSANLILLKPIKLLKCTGLAKAVPSFQFYAKRMHNIF